MSQQKTTALPAPSNREKLAELAVKWKVGPRAENAYPWIIGAVVGALVFRAPIDLVTFEKLIKDVLPAAMSVAAIFAGFQGAIHAILLTMLKSSAVRTLRKLGHFDRLIRFIRSGLLSLTLHVAASILVLFFYDLGKCSPNQFRMIAALLAALFAFSLLASVRIIMLEVKILALPDDDQLAAL